MQEVRQSSKALRRRAEGELARFRTTASRSNRPAEEGDAAGIAAEEQDVEGDFGREGVVGVPPEEE